MSYDAWALLISFAGLLVNGTGLAFVAIQVALARAQATKARESEAVEMALRRKESTISFHVSTMEQRRVLWGALPDDFDETAIAAFIREVRDGAESTRESDLRDYLSLMETFALGVSIGVYDLKTVSQMMGSRISSLANAYRPYFEHLRRQTGISTLYVEIEWLDRELTSLCESLPDDQRRALRQPRSTSEDRTSRSATST